MMCMERSQRYEQVYQQYMELLKSELPREVHLNNLCALLKKEFNFFWVGFYMRKNADLLEIGPYQGEVPCFEIRFGRGVCGTAAQTGLTQRIDDVNSFPGYIACHPEPRSEMVIPGQKENQCLFVLDLDHEEEAWFGVTDQEWIEKLVAQIVDKLF